MALRRFWLIVPILLVAGLLVSPVGDWLAGLSDSSWWAAVPWLLIILCWIIVIHQLRRTGRADAPARGT